MVCLTPVTDEISWSASTDRDIHGGLWGEKNVVCLNGWRSDSSDGEGMTVGGFYFDSDYLPGNEGRFWVDPDYEPLFIIEPVIRTSHLVFHAVDAPEALRGIAMVAFDRTEGFCPYSISIDDGKLFHIHGFVAVDKTDRERYYINGAARYALPGHISEALQDLLRVVARDWQGTHGRQWWHIRRCIGASGCKDKKDKHDRQKNILPNYHSGSTL